MFSTLMWAMASNLLFPMSFGRDFKPSMERYDTSDCSFFASVLIPQKQTVCWIFFCADPIVIYRF